MGESRCQIIIIEGNLAYASTEIFAKNHPSIETAFLEAAIKASCDGIHHASLYLQMEDEEDKLTSDITQPIINLHKKIIQKLTNHVSVVQNDINELAISLFRATRQIYTVYGTTVESLDLINLNTLIG